MGKKFAVRDAVGRLCRSLSALGCVYEIEGSASQYVYVRRPLPAKFRVSDHRPKLSRFLRDTGRALYFFDIGPHNLTVQQAVDAYREKAAERGLRLSSETVYTPKAPE